MKANLKRIRSKVQAWSFERGASGCSDRRLMLRYFSGLIYAATGGFIPHASAQSQAFPTKPMRFVVPFPAGGGVDLVARTIAEKISNRLGQSIVIENRPGAGTAIGTEIVVKSPPDGYTWLVSPVGGQGVLHAMKAKLPFDARKDLVSVGRIAYGTVALVVPASSKAKTVQELVAMAKANPGKMTYASSGTGALIHLTGEMFKLAAQVDMVHVPYKGTIQIIPDLIDGRVDMALDSLPAYLPHLKAGRLRALAVASRQRSALLPDQPTMAEVGLPSVVSFTDYGMFAAAGTPQDIVNLMNKEMLLALGLEDVKAKLAAAGIDVAPSSPDQMRAELIDEYKKWAGVVKAAGLKPE
ncbi:MAG: tripartite tricarboxylate transporter substrate binding protein [Betaproteobacteria bacterium]|nr:tripartite tricarboxylate transporter substrate binding protein [Betaproteobacteria bacterium]